MLETVVIEPEQPAQGAVIFLHGLGADGHDFEPIVPELGVDDLQLRFVFPHAPERPITINEGEPLRAWYDFVPHSEHAGSDDIKASALSIKALLQRQIDRESHPSASCLPGSPKAA